jgi:hypothetical protein
MEHNRKDKADTLYPIGSFTATAANSKVYSKAPQASFNSGAFRIFFYMLPETLTPTYN